MIGQPGALVQVPNQRLFNTSAAADYLGISVDTLRAYANVGKIRARRLRGRRVFDLVDLNEFIDNLPDYNDQTTVRPGGKPGGKETNNGN